MFVFTHCIWFCEYDIVMEYDYIIVHVYMLYLNAILECFVLIVVEENILLVDTGQYPNLFCHQISWEATTNVFSTNDILFWCHMNNSSVEIHVISALNSQPYNLVFGTFLSCDKFSFISTTSTELCPWGGCAIVTSMVHQTTGRKCFI